jgi:hypothetical protein
MNTQQTEINVQDELDLNNYAYIEPLLIIIGNNKWVHPYIETYAEKVVDEVTGEDGTIIETFEYYNSDVYRIYLENENKENMTIVFHSLWIEAAMEVFREIKDLPKGMLFEKPFIDMDLFPTLIEVTLLEDAWCPSPKENTEEIFEQFCCMPFYNNVCNYFKKDYRITWISLDCDLCKHNDNDDWDYES